MSRQSVRVPPSGSRHPPTPTHMLCQKSPTPVWSWSVSFGQIGHLNRRMLVWVLLSPMAEFYTAFNIGDKHVQCERAYFSSNVKLNQSLTSLGKFDQAPDEHCTVIVHIPPHRAFAVKSNSRVGSIVTFDVFTNYDIVNGECQNWKRKTSCYLFMKQLSEGHQESLTAMHARVTNPSASSRHLAKASKDNGIFRRLADYCGGQRPFSSFLTIARQLRAKVVGYGQRRVRREGVRKVNHSHSRSCFSSFGSVVSGWISTRTQFVPCSCSADPSFDGRSVSLATFCTPTLRNLTLGYTNTGIQPL
ncbi:hypothetical protein T06_9094 [Trichinella sp. T6]|nr:hypothetical protein T06_9094 [Trichinella sp. T6]